MIPRLTEFHDPRGSSKEQELSVPRCLKEVSMGITPLLPLPSGTAGLGKAFTEMYHFCQEPTRKKEAGERKRTGWVWVPPLADPLGCLHGRG